MLSVCEGHEMGKAKKVCELRVVTKISIGNYEDNQMCLSSDVVWRLCHLTARPKEIQQERNGVLETYRTAVVIYSSAYDLFREMFSFPKSCRAENSVSFITLYDEPVKNSLELTLVSSLHSDLVHTPAAKVLCKQEHLEPNFRRDGPVISMRSFGTDAFTQWVGRAFEIAGKTANGDHMYMCWEYDA